MGSIFLLLPILALVVGAYSSRPARSQRLEWTRAALRAYLLVVAPVLFLLVSDSGSRLDCCNPSLFSPAHRPTGYALIALVWGAYLLSKVRRTAGPPLLDLLLNVVLCLGLWFDVAVCLQAGHFWENPEHRGAGGEFIALIGCAPIAVLLAAQLLANHRLNVERLAASDFTGWRRDLQRFLASPLWLQLPLCSLLAVPVLALVGSLLVLLGQRPDSAIRLFTDTYFQGLSTLNPECAEVDCGGHYLCTIAARGHHTWVRPLRHGSRGGRRILCNRQLLVANAFEQVLQERCPSIHRRVRRRYDAIGALLNRRQRLFRNPWVCDAVYTLMKPAELFFLAVLYLCDSHPEQRIERQYRLR